jgi:hypothetical protein
VEIGRER